MIKEAGDYNSILDIVESHARRLNPIHLTATWTALSKLSEHKAVIRRHEQFKLLMEISEQSFGTSEFTGQELALVAHSAAKLQGDARGELKEFFHSLADTSVSKMATFAPREMSITAWAFASSRQAQKPLFDALAREAISKMDEFKAQDISNMAWAFATAKIAAPELFEQLASAAISKVDDFAPQGLANMAWAFATAGQKPRKLFSAIGNSAAERAPDCKPRELANLAWAFATIEQNAAKMFNAFAEEAVQRADTFNDHDLVITTWAFATIGFRSEEFYEAMAATSRLRASAFTPKALSLAVTAFQRARHPVARFFAQKLEALTARTAKGRRSSLSAVGSYGQTRPAADDRRPSDGAGRTRGHGGNGNGGRVYQGADHAWPDHLLQEGKRNSFYPDGDEASATRWKKARRKVVDKDSGW
eukprot:6199925-Pleurochrysis_carterae.AAC.1